jgi:hypothetical protein
MRPNPHAGETDYYIPCGKTITFTHKGELPEFMNENNTIISTKVFNCNPLWNVEYEGYINDPEIVEACINAGVNLTISQDHQHVQLIHPEPDYLYEYEDTLVKCSRCKEEFDHEELEADSIDDFYSNTICPKCQKWNCCEVEYESIAEALKRKNVI